MLGITIFIYSKNHMTFSHKTHVFVGRPVPVEIAFGIHERPGISFIF